MREILFRGKRTDNGEWAEGDLRQDNDIGTKYISGWKYYTDEDGLQREPYEYEIDQETVCQYTGLNDKNGRKIFEGDIVRRIDLHTTKEPSIGFIEYDTENTSFLIHWTDVQNYSATFPWKDKIEVIGNIFDNLKLVN